MKRYAGEDFTFIINRVKLDDRGEYIIRAENHFGYREEIVFLNVQRKSPNLPMSKNNYKYTFLNPQLFQEKFLSTNQKPLQSEDERPWATLCGRRRRNARHALPSSCVLVSCKCSRLASCYAA
jgi:hypothetical protein